MINLDNILYFGMKEIEDCDTISFNVCAYLPVKDCDDDSIIIKKFTEKIMAKMFLYDVTKQIKNKSDVVIEVE